MPADFLGFVILRHGGAYHAEGREPVGADGGVYRQAQEQQRRNRQQSAAARNRAYEASGHACRQRDDCLYYVHSITIAMKCWNDI